jgi:hypothetical protein
MDWKDRQALFGASDGGNDAPDSATVMEAVAVSADAEGAMFTLPDWDNLAFGPAPGPFPGAVIQAGDRLLVIFIGGDTSSSWIVGWWR